MLNIRLWPIALLLALILTLPAIARAQETQNRAGLLIRHGDGHVVTICVRFGEPAISGAQLLDRAGVSYLAQAGGMGSAVCKLDGEGCDYPTEDCFCQCKGANCTYWSYQHLRDGKWSYSQVGAVSYTVRPGDVDGWAWGPGTVQNGAQPPVMSFDQICTEAAAPAPATEAAAPPPTTAEPPPPTQVVAPPTPPTEVPASPRPPQPTHAIPSPPSAVTQVAAAPSTVPPETAEPHPTAAPQPPTAEPRPTAAPTQPPAPSLEPRPPATGAPVATSEPAGGAALPRTAPQASGGPAPATDYLAFGAIIVLLGGAIVVVLLRRRARER